MRTYKILLRSAIHIFDTERRNTARHTEEADGFQRAWWLYSQILAEMGEDTFDEFMSACNRLREKEPLFSCEITKYQIAILRRQGLEDLAKTIEAANMLV